MTPSITTESKLSTLWLVTILNMIFADILTAFIAFEDRSVLAIPGDPKTTLALSAVVLNIPIIMIYLSKVLPYKLNRISNIIAGIITILFVVGGGSLLPHYIIIATIEVLLLVTIIYTSVKWKQSVAE